MSNERKEKFTPGPWGFAIAAPYTFDGENLAIVDKTAKEGERVPVICLITERKTQNERDTANAHLIAAAPDMYAVLTELEESVDYWSEYDVPIGIIDQIRAALSKARGEA